LFIDLFVDKKRDWAFWEGGGLEMLINLILAMGSYLSAGTLSNMQFRPQAIHGGGFLTACCFFCSPDVC
jgi:hypothetical protein